eukprot:gene7659-biopygen1522
MGKNAAPQALKHATPPHSVLFCAHLSCPVLSKGKVKSEKRRRRRSCERYLLAALVPAHTCILRWRSPLTREEEPQPSRSRRGCNPSSRSRRLGVLLSSRSRRLNLQVHGASHLRTGPSCATGRSLHQQSTHSKFFDEQGLAIFALHWKKPVQQRNVELARRWSLQMRVNDLEMKARGGGLPRVASRQKSSSLYGQSFSGCQKVVGGGGVYSSQGLGVWGGSQGSPGATFPAISEPNRAL